MLFATKLMVTVAVPELSAVQAGLFLRDGGRRTAIAPEKELPLITPNRDDGNRMTV